MHRTSSSQVKAKGDIASVSSVSDSEPLDINTPPERYFCPGNPYSKSTPREDPHTRHSTTPNISSDGRRTSLIRPTSNQPCRTQDPNQQQSINQQSTPKKQTQGIFRWITSTIRPDSTESEAERLPKAQADEINRLINILHDRDDVIKSMSENNIKDKEHQQQYFREKWQQREEELDQIKAQQDNTIHSLHVQVEDLASNRREIQEKYNTLVRRQQEESFKQMETGRWLPKEESRVLADFERVKTQMRTWAKSAAVKDIAGIQDLEEDQHASFMASLSRMAFMASLSLVAIVENNRPPPVLLTPKGPSLLLNALLAHDVYTSLFRNPFFFLSNEVERGPTGVELDDSLNKIYGFALASNVEDAHKWRSTTLRLLLPQPRAGNTEGEKNLHQSTEEMIATVAELHASRFAANSARYLIDTNTANFKKLNSIYQEAASVSYMLWTRKTAMKLVTLGDMGSPTFDVDDSRFKPHTMVHPDDHDDKLKGRKVTLIVHPLLLVYGTDEGKNYDNARVWVPAEVWFNTK